MQDVDVILWLVEPSDFIGGGDSTSCRTVEKVQDTGDSCYQ